MAIKTPAEQAATDNVFFFQQGSLGHKQVSYTAGESFPTVINAVINFFSEPEDYRRGQRDNALIWIRAEDVSQPAYKDSIEIDDAVWRVLRIVSKTAILFELEIEKNMRPGKI